MLVALGSGCHDVVTEGDVLQVSWGIWARVVVIAGAVLFAGLTATLAWRVRSLGEPRRGLFLPLIFAGVTALMSLIGFLLVEDHLVLATDEVYDVHGLPWARERRGFQFGDVARVVVRKEEVWSARTTRIDKVWYLTLKGGGTRIIEPGDLWDVAEDEIVTRLEEAGVPVERDFSASRQPR